MLLGDVCDADGDLCTANDVCADSGMGYAECVPGPPVDCDDGNLCTDDACIPATGACDYGFNTAPRDADGNSCTEDDI